METPSPYPEVQQSGLSTTSFVLSFVGLLLCMTLIGIFLGIPLSFLGLIFGIIALAKKQKKGLAIAGIIMGGIIALFTMVVFTLSLIFWNNNKDVLLEPIKSFAQLIEEDPQVASTIQDQRFEADFETALRSNLSGKINEDTIENREDLKGMIPMLYEESVSVILELKEKYLATGGFQPRLETLPIQSGAIEDDMIDISIRESQTGAVISGSIKLPGNEPSTCKDNTDCIPLPSECHPTACINKVHEAEYMKPEICTTIFMVEAAYSPEDCECRANVCSNKNLEKK